MAKRNIVQPYSYQKSSSKTIDPKILNDHIKNVEKDVIPDLKQFQERKEQSANDVKKLRITYRN